MIHKGENYSVKMQKYYFCNRTISVMSKKLIALGLMILVISITPTTVVSAEPIVVKEKNIDMKNMGIKNMGLKNMDTKKETKKEELDRKIEKKEMKLKNKIKNLEMEKKKKTEKLEREIERKETKLKNKIKGLEMKK